MKGLDRNTLVKKNKTKSNYGEGMHFMSKQHRCL